MGDPILTVDIGGSKTAAALFDPVSPTTPLCYKRYENYLFTRVSELFAILAEDFSSPIAGVCVAVAGVVTEDAATLTNRNWHLRVAEIKGFFPAAEILLLNDMTALALAVQDLSEDKGLVRLSAVKAKEQKEGERLAVIAPGTGLGEGYYIHRRRRPLACGGEGGHAGFAPAGPLQTALFRWLQKSRNHVSWETLLSGPGIARLYRFATEKLCHPSAAKVTDLPLAEQSFAILAAALGNPPCMACRHALELFLAVLGNEAGNLALTLYATGGVYIGGGIVRQLPGRHNLAPILRAFCDKGPMSPLLETIPLYIITSETSINQGCVRYWSLCQNQEED